MALANTPANLYASPRGGLLNVVSGETTGSCSRAPRSAGRAATGSASMVVASAAGWGSAGRAGRAPRGGSRAAAGGWSSACAAPTLLSLLVSLAAPSPELRQ
eukprot:4925853-Alexandrium_andersonii.AAC.1